MRFTGLFGIVALTFLLGTLLSKGVLAHTWSVPPKHVAEAHLVLTQIRDMPDVPLESLTVYVLSLPGRGPLVYKAFGSTNMEDEISRLPHGSVLHYDGSPLRWPEMQPPTSAQLGALAAYCKKQGIRFMISATS